MVCQTGARALARREHRPKEWEAERLDVEAVRDDEQSALMPQEIVDSWKELSSKLARLRRVAQQVDKASGRWDLRQLRQRLPELSQAAADAAGSAREADLLLSAWTTPEAGAAIAAYAAEIERAARQARLPLTGDFPEYEAFPLTIRVDLPGEQVLVGRRRLGTLEPAALVRELQRQFQAVHSSSFNARRFMQSLVRSYDLLIGSGSAKGRGVQLLDIYGVLTLRTGTAGYSRQEFAFDIFRLRRESDLTFEGRRLAFMNARRGGIPVPSAQGKVEMFGTLEVREVEGLD